jgi:hypothetical protein
MTGMRSMSALAAVSTYFNEHAPTQKPDHVRWRRRPDYTLTNKR